MRSVDYHGYTIKEDGTILGLNGNAMKPSNNNGRYEIRLVVDGKRRNFLVARLVYYVFKEFDIANKDLCVTAIDGDNLNTHIDNLELKHRKDLIQGDKHINRAKLSDEQVEEIRGLYKGSTGVNQHDKVGYSLRDLADMYGVTWGNIRMIVKGESRNEDRYKLK